jgi:cytochrome bd ubiquinol oxidase subunit I
LIAGGGRTNFTGDGEVDRHLSQLWPADRRRRAGLAVPAVLPSMTAALAAIGASSLAPVQQDYLLEARQMQSLSFAAHIPLVCFAISFPAMVLFTEWMFLRTGDELYRTLAKRWSRVMLALFAVGVVTGTILSFDFGLLWPGFTATFGSVFGLAFAIEGISFFMEAIFIGIYLYGWDRLSPRLHFLSGIPIAIAGFLGSMTVISVNGWMNHPEGFRLSGGEAVDVHPFKALFVNSYFWHELMHMYFAGYMVAGFLVAGAYAFGRLRGRWGRYERTAFLIPLTAAALASPVNVLIGDWAGREVAREQPVKLAAFEGLPQTKSGADLTILGWYTDNEVKYGIKVPKALSLLAFHDPNATVKGLDTVPADERPPINIVRVSFQTMVVIGTLLAIFGVVYLIMRVRRRPLPTSPWFYRFVVAAGPLALIATVAGWFVTEVGRQPWVVYRQMRTSEAITGAGGIPVGYATLVAVYVGLAVAVVWILRRLAAAPLETPREAQTVTEAA